MGKEIDTRSMSKEISQDIEMPGNNRLITEIGVINKDYLAQLAFMEEEITVMVHESADENADNPVTVGNNGTFRQFFRGQPTRVKRKFVDSLIVKSGRVATPETQNGAGERTRVIRQTSAQKYPFSIMEDKNPKGAEWLRGRLAELV
jgi:hypothetical protein